MYAIERALPHWAPSLCLSYSAPSFKVRFRVRFPRYLKHACRAIKAAITNGGIAAPLDKEVAEELNRLGAGAEPLLGLLALPFTSFASFFLYFLLLVSIQLSAGALQARIRLFPVRRYFRLFFAFPFAESRARSR